MQTNNCFYMPTFYCCEKIIVCGVDVIMYVALLSAILVIPNSCFFMVMKVLHQCELRV